MALTLQVRHADPSAQDQDEPQDWTSRVSNLTFTTGPHGFEVMRGKVKSTIREAVNQFDILPGKHVWLNDNQAIAFEGRIEEITIEINGFSFVALGHWIALSDVPYTALWSDSSTSANWREGTSNQNEKWQPERYSLKNIEELQIMLVRGERYNTGNHYGVYVYHAPHLDRNLVKEITYSYAYKLPTGWVVIIRSYEEGLLTAGRTIEDTFTSTGVLATGTKTVTFASPRAAFAVEVYNNSGVNLGSSPNQTGRDYAQITDIRVKGTESATLFGDEIANDIVDFVAGINDGHLHSTTMLIQSQGQDLTDKVYVDASPADVLTDLATLGDDETPPRPWETGVWEDKMVHLRPVNDKAITWHAEMSDMRLTLTLSSMFNSGYGTYKSEHQRLMRGTTDDDLFSQKRYGVIRRAVADTGDSTSSAQAGIERDVLLEDQKYMLPNGSITVKSVQDPSGAHWPLWKVRAGDTIAMQVLPPTGEDLVDHLTTFRITSTLYDVDNDKLIVHPSTENVSMARSMSIRRGGPIIVKPIV